MPKINTLLLIIDYFKRLTSNNNKVIMTTEHVDILSTRHKYTIQNITSIH